jgi:hypothetical protein
VDPSEDDQEAVMSAEMITATGFQLVVVDVGLHPLRGKRAPDAAWVRLARTAESHGTAMLVSSPYPITGTASEAVVKGCGGRPLWIGREERPSPPRRSPSVARARKASAHEARRACDAHAGRCSP